MKINVRVSDRTLSEACGLSIRWVKQDRNSDVGLVCQEFEPIGFCMAGGTEIGRHLVFAASHPRPT